MSPGEQFAAVLALLCLAVFLAGGDFIDAVARAARGLIEWGRRRRWLLRVAASRGVRARWWWPKGRIKDAIRCSYAGRGVRA